MQNEIFDLKLVIINDNNLGFNKNKCFDMKASDGNFSKVFLSLNTLYYCIIILRTRREAYVSSLP